MKKLLVATILVCLAMTSQAMGKNGMAHANPMPNLMRIVEGNADLLGLDAKQREGLQVWIKANRANMQEMIKSVMKQEQMLKENALTTDTDIEKQVDSLLETRKKIMMTKTKCRAELKKILTPEQYKNVVNIYRSAQPMRMMKKKM